MRKEWNITYAIHDGYGGKDEYFIILPAWWKVALWLLTHVHKCCEIYIWTSGRLDDDAWNKMKGGKMGYQKIGFIRQPWYVLKYALHRRRMRRDNRQRERKDRRVQ